MTTNEIFLLIILTIGWATAVAIELQCRKWHNKHDEAVSMWTIESRRKDKQIEKLENELKTYKDMERVIKIEQVHAEPREYTCKFSVHERFIDDMETFKRICISEVSRYMAEELEKDPMAYKVYFEKNAWTGCNTVKIMFRLLPYPEGTMSFEEIMDEVKRRENE